MVAPWVHADNKRLNSSVFANIYTAQRQNGCSTEPRLDSRLVDAARRHTLDVLNTRDVNGDIGSDGSSPQGRARDAGFVGKVAETVAINAAMAINGIEILNQWWHDPRSRATMQDCAHTAIGVWSENSPDRSVVVAVYGQPGTP
ncbi:CAP domain-containing protein [Mycobacterium novum]